MPLDSRSWACSPATSHRSSVSAQSRCQWHVRWPTPCSSRCMRGACRRRSSSHTSAGCRYTTSLSAGPCKKLWQRPKIRGQDVDQGQFRTITELAIKCLYIIIYLYYLYDPVCMWIQKAHPDEQKLMSHAILQAWHWREVLQGKALTPRDLTLALLSEHSMNGRRTSSGVARELIWGLPQSLAILFRSLFIGRISLRSFS